MPKVQLTWSWDLPHPKPNTGQGQMPLCPCLLSPRDTQAQVWPLPPSLVIGAAWWKWDLGAVCSSQNHLPGPQTALRRKPAHKVEVGQAGPDKPCVLRDRLALPRAPWSREQQNCHHHMQQHRRCQRQRHEGISALGLPCTQGTAHGFTAASGSVKAVTPKVCSGKRAIKLQPRLLLEKIYSRSVL